MTKLAELAGVSVSTVSKAFSGSAEVSEEKRKHIFRVAKETGCYDKYCKNEYKGVVIAVICPEYNSRSYSEMLRFLEKEIQKRGGIMITGSTGFSVDRGNQLFSFFSEYSKVDGIISLTGELDGIKCAVPVVVCARNEFYNSVVASEDAAICDAVALLKQYGHSRIGYIGDRLSHTRCEKFITSMKKNGIEVSDDLIIEKCERFESAGYTAMNELFEKGEIPTAVVASYDNVAIGVMKSIYDHGLKIPDDISIIGFDDIMEATYLGVPLTTITSFTEELCEIVVRRLYEIIEKRIKEVKSIKVKKQLVVRESVGKVRGR